MITYFCCLSFSVVSPGVPRLELQYELPPPPLFDRGLRRLLVRDAQTPRLQNIHKVLTYLLNNVTTVKMIYCKYYEGDFVETYPR